MIDTATFMIVFIILAIITMISYHAFKQIQPQIQPDFNDSVEANETINIIDTSYPSTFDGGIVFVFFGLWIAVLVASFQIDTHPIFFAISLILLVAICVATVMISNFYQTLFADDSFVGLTSYFPMTNWLAEHLLIIVVAIGLSIMLVLYAKTR